MNDKTKISIAIVGAGYMGGGMATTFALNGYQCIIADLTESSAAQSLERVIRETQTYEKNGLYEDGSAKIVSDNVRSATGIETAVEQSSYIAEVVTEDLNAKSSVLQRIAAASPSNAVIASNTSAIPILKLSDFVSLPERFLGVHWMNPAPFIPGVEIVASAQTSEVTMKFAESLMKDVGKVPCRVSDTPGFVANRLQFMLFKEASRMVEEGIATPEQIDHVVCNSFGFRLPFFGPFSIADMAGLDVYAGAYSTLSDSLGERFEVPQSLISKVDAGELGVKTHGGFTDLHTYKKEVLGLKRDQAYAALAKCKAAFEDLEL